MCRKGKKRQMAKKVLSVILALTMCVGSVPVNALAAEKKEALTPIHYYSFDEAANEDAVDEGTAKVNGKKTNVGTAEGWKGSAAKFNGGTVDVADTTFNDRTAYTISAWINWDGTLSASNTIVDTANLWFHVRKQGGNDKKLWGGYYGSNWTDVSGGDNLVPENVWTHVAYVSDGNGAKLYMNGELVGQNAEAAGKSGQNKTLKIGNDSNNHPFHGLIDEVKIYDTALDADQIKTVMDDVTEAQWSMQHFGSDQNLELQDGWIVPDESGDGFLVDYGKIYQANGGNIVVYDQSAPSYEDSVLEFDITVTGGQPDKYQVAFFPRFQSGRNCDGFAIGEKKQLQHSYQVNGSEGWPGVSNNLDMAFEVDQTYHIKMVTAGNTMTVYADGKLLTSFETRSEITEGGFGFRVWTQIDTKTVHVENIVRSKYVVSKLEKTETIIKSDEWGMNDVVIPVTFGEADTIASVKNAEAALAEGTDYTVDENGITLKKEYIAQQADSFALDILFAEGTEARFMVTKLDTTTKEYTWTPEKGIDEWNKIAGSGSVTMEENGMRVKGDTKLVNTKTPYLTDGEIELTFEQLTDYAYMGFLFRAAMDGTWQGVMQDDDYGLQRWYYHNSNGNRNGIHGDGSFLLSRDGEADTKLKLRFQGKTLSMWMDDQFMYTGNVSQVSDALGRMGLLTGSKCDILVKKVVFRSVLPFMTEEDNSENEMIAKDGLSVTLAADFPRVKEYDLNGKTMKGAEFKYNYVTINSVDYPATAVVSSKTEDSVTYTVDPDGSDVTFDVVYTVLDGHILDMHIKNIVEPEGQLVYSIGMPNQPLISANSSQAGAKLDASVSVESMGDFHNSKLTDVHYKISDDRISKTADGLATIPVITTDELSASMANNVLLNIQEFRFRAFDLADGTVSAGFWNNEYMYRGLDGEKLFPIASEPEEENLYCQVILTEDTNNDSKMDWQDGANALKKLVGDRIPGGENTARTFFEVGYNFVSEAQQPFIKVGDNLKRMSNLIDGFPQHLVLKGYASEGHDSGHADYDDINKRAGGAEDLNAMTEAIKDINATFGIHINHTEAYPEAEMYNDHVISTKNAWKWMDQSKSIRREADILNTAEGQRTMDERLDSMFEKAPGIDFVYVDTYTDDRWAETRMANNLIKNGASIGTENQNDFNRYNMWVHWPEINADSIHHFVYHTQKDVYRGSSVYWGGYGRADSFMSWQHRNNINVVMKQFYTNQLPQKYLMCHEVLKDDGTTGYFEGNVTSSNYQIRKDGKLLTDGQNKIFIPWYAEDSETKNPDEAAKIYHWNGNGGETTWEVPTSWENLENVYLYKATQTGKKFVSTVAVVDGKVTINADRETPYLVYPGEAAEDVTEWSEGSPLKDGGFNSRDFSIWEKSGNADIQYNDDGNGVSILTMEGTEEGAVSQTMTGLVPGQKYRAVVWAGAENGKTARVTVETPDGKTHMNYMEQIVRANDCFDTYAKGKRVNRVWVDFVQPEGETTAKITFSADACENSAGKATFMESRLVRTAEPELPEGYVANETFEYVEQGGTGIFTPEGGGDGGYHISHYTEYTDDAININGEYSLKMYGAGSANMRTYPATMRLEPNRAYTMEFDALGYGTVMIVSETDGSDKPMSQSFEEGHNSYTFITGDKTDYIARLEGGSRKVLDNFVVKKVAIDRAALEKLIADAKTLVESEYNPADWIAFQKEIAKAQVALDKDNSTEEDIETAFYELNTAMAGMQKSGGSDSSRDLPVEGMTATAGSEENTQGSDYARNVLDGNTSSIWHTDWDGTAMENRWIDIALTEPTTVGGVRILSRSGSTKNGLIRKANIFVKTADAEDYVKVADNAVFGSDWQSAVFEEVENVTNVKIHATETQGNWASAAEIRIMGAEKEVESVVDKTALQAAVDAAKALNEIDYTAESWAVLETKLAAAEAALAKEDATDYDVLLAEANLKNAVKLLVLDEEEGVYKVIVNGGEGTCKALYNQSVTVKAAAPEEGKKFVGWYVDSKLVSKTAEYTFYVSGDIVLDAVYADEDAEPVEMEAAAQVTNLLVTERADTKSDVKFVAQLIVPEGWKVAQAGLVWTSKEDVVLVTDGSLNPEAKATYIKAISNTNQFSVTVKGMPAGRFLRGQIFAKLVNEDGEVQWVYSDEYRAEAK